MVWSDVGDDPYFSTVLKIHFNTGIVRFIGHWAKPLGFFYIVQIELGSELYTFSLRSYIFLAFEETIEEKFFKSCSLVYGTTVTFGLLCRQRKLIKVSQKCSPVKFFSHPSVLPQASISDSRTEPDNDNLLLRQLIFALIFTSSKPIHFFLDIFFLPLN